MTTQPDIRAVPVVIPKEATTAQMPLILNGSGIVAIPDEFWLDRTPSHWPQADVDDVRAARTLTLDYEGNRVGSAAFATWADRVHHAHGRQAQRYPTTARVHRIPAGLVDVVATYDPIDGDITVLDDTDPDRVRAWLGVSDLEEQLHTTSSAAHDQRRSIRRALTNGTPPREQITWFARRYGHDDLLDR
jgi:hypothetical protein